MSNPTPATVHARLCAYVDSQPGASETARLNAAARSLYVTRNAVWRWMHGERKTPMWLENALNWLEYPSNRVDALLYTFATGPESEVFGTKTTEELESVMATLGIDPTPVSDTPTEE